MKKTIFIIASLMLLACSGSSIRQQGTDSPPEKAVDSSATTFTTHVPSKPAEQQPCDTAFVFAEPENPDSAEVERAEAWLTDVYRKWMRANGIDTTLAKMMFTEEMREKCDRVGRETYSDPLFFTIEEYPEEGINSVTCTHMGGGWYEVSFTWSEGCEVYHVPVRLKKDGDAWKIMYLRRIDPKTPWTGDSLFDIRGCRVVDTAGSEQFVRTFFTQYTYLYSIMPPRLEERLDSMRRKYFTANMAMDFAESRENFEGSIYEGYDQIILGNDFDIHEYRSHALETDSIPNSFILTKPNLWGSGARIKAVRRGGKWKIDEWKDLPK